ncbi:cellulose binding domain-containing protein [Dactylosporangium sp. NPDC000521]|uniref:cellulose binding domain-containing protein n=1 Tax=Dactylosporangium sp. NPDC000521 TaxID=3363975 RepID=UPI003675AAF1
MTKRLAVLGAAGACAALLVVYLQLPSAEATVPPPAAPVTGNATYFDGLGSPYGGCGLPQAELETQDFVALNVFDTPGDGSYNTRPVPPAMADKMGVWDNGRNCGRWVQVKIADYCTGTNDGALGQPFCRNGSWTSDAYNGGVLNMLVADSCADTNAWCRDDPYHLDLSKASLNRFSKNGSTLGDLYPNHWNNRHVDWNFIPAPAYSGDIQIGFLSGAQRWWPAIAVSRLPNGVHGVEYYADGAWRAAQPNRDMGQSFVIGGTTSGGTQFRIRVTDAADALVFGGREYSFSLPDACSAQCGPAYTRATYTTTGASPSVSVSPSRSASPSVSVSPSRSVSGSVSPSASRSPSASASASAGGCTATVTVTGSWDGGYQAEVTVRNTGGTASTGWTTALTFAGTQRVASSWNAVTTQSGTRVTATNQPYNAVIPPAGTTSWGMVVTGQNQPVSAVTCTLR